MQMDWDPGAYDAFRGLRLRPALDLLHALGEVPPGDVVDLGCGSGAVGAALRRAFGTHRLIGLDASPAMLAQAEHTKAYDALELGDLARWQPDAPPALIFSNAVLQWLPDHAALLPHLGRHLAPGGWLAVQMPGQNDAPSHAAYRRLTGQVDTGQTETGPGILAPETYEALLAPLGQVRVWETRYYQLLPPWSDDTAPGHPVRAFTRSTYGRAFTQTLSPDALRRFEAAYDAEMAEAYPVRSDGTVLFPFRRVFVLLQRGPTGDVTPP